MFNEIKDFFLKTGYLGKIIALNIAVFVVVNLVYVFLDLFLVDGVYVAGTRIPKLVYWLSAPANLIQFISRPWTWITYMFLHEGFGHIFFNMVMLYFSGRILSDLLGEKRFLPTYILGGLSGLFLFVLGYNIFPKLYDQNFAIIYGASASVMAVFVATATYFPNYEVYLFGVFRVKLKWLAIVYVAVDFVALRGMSNVGGHLAHLGGAIYGFLYAKTLAAGTDWSDVFNQLWSGILTLFKPKPAVRVVHRNTDSQNSRTNMAEKQVVIDSILDKINKSGYDSLTKGEKELLLKASKE